MNNSLGSISKPRNTFLYMEMTHVESTGAQGKTGLHRNKMITHEKQECGAPVVSPCCTSALAQLYPRGFLSPAMGCFSVRLKAGLLAACGTSIFTTRKEQGMWYSSSPENPREVQNVPFPERHFSL